MKITLIAAIRMIFFALQAEAQSYISGSEGWNSSYGFPSATERNARLAFILEQEKLKNKYYRPPSTVVTNYNTVDRSVTNTITAGEGANVDVENHTAENSGTRSNVVGAINESTTNISTDGSGSSSINVGNAADSQGCIDGAITSNVTSPVGGFDISSSAGSASSGSVSVSRGNC